MSSSIALPVVVVGRRRCRWLTRLAQRGNKVDAVLGVSHLSTYQLGPRFGSGTINLVVWQVRGSHVIR